MKPERIKELRFDIERNKRIIQNATGDSVDDISVGIPFRDAFELLAAADRANRLEEDIEQIGHIVDVTLTTILLNSPKTAKEIAADSLRNIGSIVSGDARQALAEGENDEAE